MPCIVNVLRASGNPGPLLAAQAIVSFFLAAFDQRVEGLSFERFWCFQRGHVLQESLFLPLPGAPRENVFVFADRARGVQSGCKGVRRFSLSP